MPPFWVLWLIVCALAFVCFWTGLRWRGAIAGDPHLSPWQRHRDRRLADTLLLAAVLLALTAFLSSAFVAIPIWGWL